MKDQTPFIIIECTASVASAHLICTGLNRREQASTPAAQAIGRNRLCVDTRVAILRQQKCLFGIRDRLFSHAGAPLSKSERVFTNRHSFTNRIRFLFALSIESACESSYRLSESRPTSGRAPSAAATQRLPLPIGTCQINFRNDCVSRLWR